MENAAYWKVVSLPTWEAHHRELPYSPSFACLGSCQSASVFAPIAVVNAGKEKILHVKAYFKGAVTC